MVRWLVVCRRPGFETRSVHVKIVFGQIVTGTGVSPYTLACHLPTSYIFCVFVYMSPGNRPKSIAGSESEEHWIEKKFHFYLNG